MLLSIIIISIIFAAPWLVLGWLWHSRRRHVEITLADYEALDVGGLPHVVPVFNNVPDFLAWYDPPHVWSDHGKPWGTDPDDRTVISLPDYLKNRILPDED